MPVSSPVEALATRTDLEQRTIAIYKKANESVVYINTFRFKLDPFDLLAELSSQEGSGSGIIVDSSKGIIITNLHVIQEAHKLEIVLADGSSHGARLLGYDRAYDIAVLKLDSPIEGQPGPDLKALPFGKSANLVVGQQVLAIGNPFGLNKTLTTGIISSLDRTVRTPAGVLMKGVIQTDAAIIQELWWALT